MPADEPLTDIQFVKSIPGILKIVEMVSLSIRPRLIKLFLIQAFNCLIFPRNVGLRDSIRMVYIRS